MNIFKFKVSSLSKGKSNSKTNQLSIKPFTSVAPNTSRLSSEPEKSFESSNVSQFVIDESELWNDDDSDIFEVDKVHHKEQNTSGLSIPDKEKDLFLDPDNKDEDDKCDRMRDKSFAEDDGDETDIELTDYAFHVPANDETCFDLDIENNDILPEPETVRSENSKSPTFDVGCKGVRKKSFLSNDSDKNDCSVEVKLNLGCNNTKDSNENNHVKSKLFAFTSQKLNPLGLAEETDLWLEKILQNEAFFNVTSETSVQQLQNNLSFLNKSYVEILEKVMTAFESLPIEMLKDFPEFNADVFMTLRTTRRRIKAVMIKTENLLKRKPALQSTTDNQNVTISEEKKEFNQFEQELPPQKDFSRLFYSPSSDLNSSVDCSLNKSTEGVFTFKQPLKLVNKSVPELNQSKLNFHVEQSPKPSTSLNSSLIDYTDLLYQTPVKASQEKTISSTGKFHANMRNDGMSGEFDGFNFPHSRELREMFHQKFGLKSFRPNQLQVINAALLGFDCFVLMPTGGGKSLCYQLPAIVSKGVTVVISPLRSLILDQVTKLLTLDISAGHLSGDIKESEASLVYRKLNQPEPTIKLLYVTPEKVGASSSLKNCLLGLYKRGMLARFVIDEAHCVSQWGHDFRPDYKKLRELRENFPKVNIMALTATATPRVRTDILHQLKVINPKWFLSSFNRSNLTYSVKEKKGKSALKEIANLIQKDFKKDTGVIYCFSRKECEDVARDLREYGINAMPYHAGLNDTERTRAQNLWMNDKVKVVCATIAFGMGIDKLDVRFVIHFSLPKSIEGYYQESGRAGRDGEKATCILYYSYRDKIRMLKLINMDQSMANQAARKVHTDNLFRVVAFAENKTDCRRALQLEYFGEKFDRKTCIENRTTTCDNCLQQGIYETIDVTSESKAIVSAVREVCGTDGQKNSNFTMLHFVDVFKGTLIKKVLFEGHNNLSMYGMGKSWQRLDVERLFRKLIMEEFLKERLMVKDDGITFAYLKFGRRGEELLKGNVKIMFEIKKRKGSTTAQSSSVSNKEHVDPAVLEIQEKCYSELMEAIHEIAISVNCNPNAIMNVQALRSMSSSLPETSEEMLSINHVTTANFEKYGNVLLEVTKKYAAEKKALKAVEIPEDDFFEDDHWSKKASDDSPYFETEISFCGKAGGKKRKRTNNFRKWQRTKKWKGAGSSNRTTSPKPKSKAKSSSANNSLTSAGVTTVSGAKYSTLMELPTSKARGFARPKVVLKNL